MQSKSSNSHFQSEARREHEGKDGSAPGLAIGLAANVTPNCFVLAEFK